METSEQVRKMIETLLKEIFSGNKWKKNWWNKSIIYDLNFLLKTNSRLLSLIYSIIDNKKHHFNTIFWASDWLLAVHFFFSAANFIFSTCESKSIRLEITRLLATFLKLFQFYFFNKLKHQLSRIILIRVKEIKIIFEIYKQMFSI
jgi:hypothetical protein